MKSKFTICYQHSLSKAVFCDQCEGRTWAEAANKAIEDHINSQRTHPHDMSDPLDRYRMNFAKSFFSVLFAFEGHQKQLI